jgi:hypothetical protein
VSHPAFYNTLKALSIADIIHKNYFKISGCASAVYTQERYTLGLCDERNNMAGSQPLIRAEVTKTLSATVHQFQKTKETKQLRELAKAEMKRHGSAGWMTHGICRWWMKIGKRKSETTMILS